VRLIAPISVGLSGPKPEGSASLRLSICLRRKRGQKPFTHAFMAVDFLPTIPIFLPSGWIFLTAFLFRNRQSAARLRWDQRADFPAAVADCHDVGGHLRIEDGHLGVSVGQLMAQHARHRE